MNLVLRNYYRTGIGLSISIPYILPKLNTFDLSLVRIIFTFLMPGKGLFKYNAIKVRRGGGVVCQKLTFTHRGEGGVWRGAKSITRDTWTASYANLILASLLLFESFHANFNSFLLICGVSPELKLLIREGIQKNNVKLRLLAEVRGRGSPICYQIFFNYLKWPRSCKTWYKTIKNI